MQYFMLFYILIDVIREERKEKPPRPGPLSPSLCAAAPQTLCR